MLLAFDTVSPQQILNSLPNIHVMSTFQWNFILLSVGDSVILRRRLDPQFSWKYKLAQLYALKRTSGNETEQAYIFDQSKKSSNFKFLRYTMSLSRICVSSWGNRICSVIRVWNCKIRTFRSHTFVKNKKNFSFAFVFDDLIFDAICVSHCKSKSFYYPLTKIWILIVIT